MKYKEEHNIIIAWTHVVWIIVMYFCVWQERFERDYEYCTELLEESKASNSSIWEEHKFTDAGWDTIAAHTEWIWVKVYEDTFTTCYEYFPVSDTTGRVK